MADIDRLVGLFCPDLAPGQRRLLKRELEGQPALLTRMRALVPFAHRRAAAVREEAERLLRIPRESRSRHIFKIRGQLFHVSLVQELVDLSKVAAFQDPGLAVELAQAAWELTIVLTGNPEVPGGRRGLFDLQARSLAVLANAHRVAGDDAEVAPALEDALLRYWDGSGDPFLLAEMLSIRASWLCGERHFREALQTTGRAFDIYSQAGETHLAGKILQTEANVFSFWGKSARATERQQQAWDLIEEDIDPLLASVILLNLMEDHHSAGRHEAAEELLGKKHHLLVQIREGTGPYLYLLRQFARTYQARGAYDTARNFFSSARDGYLRLQDLPRRAYITMDLAFLEEACGVQDDTVHLLRESTGQLRDVGYRDAQLAPLIRLASKLDRPGRRRSVAEMRRTLREFYQTTSVAAEALEEESFPRRPAGDDGARRRVALGRAFWYLRQDRGLRQEEVAERSGIPRPALSAYERGRKSPNFSTTNNLLAALQADFTDFQGALSVLRLAPGARPRPAPRPAVRERDGRSLTDLVLAGNLAGADPEVAMTDLETHLRHWIGRSGQRNRTEVRSPSLADRP